MGKKLNTIGIIVFIAVLIGGVFYGINRFNEREVNHVTFINNNDDNKEFVIMMEAEIEVEEEEWY